MKKMYGLLVAAGMLLVMIPVTVAADPVAGYSLDNMLEENAEFQLEKRQQLITKMGISSDGSQIKNIGLYGIWGHAGDNESDG